MVFDQRCFEVASKTNTVGRLWAEFSRVYECQMKRWDPLGTRPDKKWLVFFIIWLVSPAVGDFLEQQNLIVHKGEVISVVNFLLRLQGGWRQLRLSDLQITVSIVVLSLWYVLLLYLDLLMVSAVAGWAQPCILLSPYPLDFLNLLGFQCLECKVFPLVQHIQILESISAPSKQC